MVEQVGGGNTQGVNAPGAPLPEAAKVSKTNTETIKVEGMTVTVARTTEELINVSVPGTGEKAKGPSSETRNEWIADVETKLDEFAKKLETKEELGDQAETTRATKAHKKTNEKLEAQKDAERKLLEGSQLNEDLQTKKPGAPGVN